MYHQSAGEELQVVDEVKYLGVNFSEGCSGEVEAERRVKQDKFI